MKKLLFFFLMLANAAQAVTPTVTPTMPPPGGRPFPFTPLPSVLPSDTPTPDPLPIIAQWRGNSTPGQYVASYGYNLLTSGAEPVWASATDVNGAEGDHWLWGITENTGNGSYYLPIPLGTENWDTNQPWVISFLYKSNNTSSNPYLFFIETLEYPYGTPGNNDCYIQIQSFEDGLVQLYWNKTSDGPTESDVIQNVDNLNDGNVHTISFEGNSTGTLMKVDGITVSTITSVFPTLYQYPYDDGSYWGSQIGYQGASETIMQSGEYVYIDNLYIGPPMTPEIATPTPTVTPTPTPRGIAYNLGAKTDLDFSGAKSGTITISSTSGATLDIPVVQPVADKMVMVTGWTISSVDSVTADLHFGTGGAKFGIGGNFIAGGFLGEYGRLTAQIGTLASIAPTPGQGIYLDVSGATSGLEVQVNYVIY